MGSASDKKLKKLGRAELLELLVKQGEQLDAAREALAAAEERAAYQERIARLSEKAMSRLAGLLEATELAHGQYSSALAELKSQMGIAYTGERIGEGLPGSPLLACGEPQEGPGACGEPPGGPFYLAPQEGPGGEGGADGGE